MHNNIAVWCNNINYIFISTCSVFDIWFYSNAYNIIITCINIYGGNVYLTMVFLFLVIELKFHVHSVSALYINSSDIFTQVAV